MEVRRAQLEDAEPIAEIHVRSWQGAYQGLIPQDYLDGLDPARRLAFRVERLKDADWAHGGCLVITGDDGDVAGFADVGRTRDTGAGAGSDGDSGTAGDTGGIAEVMAIYLAPAAWGTGLGRELMRASLRHLTDCGYREVTLWVLASNVRARRFYEAAGFRPDGGTKVDVSHGFVLDEVRYRRPLP
jgi:ribosomal protein S18 acetylase RimI-like enzyme